MSRNGRFGRIIRAMPSIFVIRKHDAVTVVRTVLTSLLFMLAVPLPAAAQLPISKIAQSAAGSAKSAEEKASPPASIDELRERLAKVQAEIALIDRSERHAAGAPPGTPDAELQLRTRSLRVLAFSYRQHISALQNYASLQKVTEESRVTRLAWTGPNEKPPYSILLVDKMRADQQASLLNLRSEEMRLQLLVAQTENVRTSLAKANANHRRAQEALEAAHPDGINVATWRRDLAALEVQALGSFLESLLVQTRNVEANIAEFRQEVEFDRRKVGEIEKSVVFNNQDFERLKATIEERRSKLIKELDQASRERARLAAELEQSIRVTAAAKERVADLEAQLAAARQSVKTAEAAYQRAQQQDGLLDKINPFRGRAEKTALDKAQRAAVEVEAQLANARAHVRKTELENKLNFERERNGVQAVEILNISLIALDMQRSFWEQRFASQQETGADVRARQKNIESNRSYLKVLTPAMTLLGTKLEAAMKQVVEVQTELRMATDSGELAFHKSMLELLNRRERGYLEALSQIEETRHLLLRWLEQEDVESKNVSSREQFKNLFGSAGDWLKTAWNFEIFTVEDSIVVDGRTITGTRGITVAKVAQAILIVVIGYLVVAVLSRLAMRLALRKGALDETSARIARKWILAVSLVVLLLLALDVVKIPLTAFAFLGGAIAIGAGFGMQTLLKNLISGVMLLMERPFKPRDIVEVGGIRGEVTDINVRSCTIRDANGIETLVPNSTFLEQNVTNWTLTNRRVRFALNVGVAYGSSARRVADLLLEVAARHKLVLDDPAPEVLFADFADNALLFTLQVWIEVGPGRRTGNMIVSDLRFMIDASFAEHGIVIPFPQRDVHLDAAAPIPVRLVGDPGTA